jgi:hypothetical protein
MPVPWIQELHGFKPFGVCGVVSIKTLKANEGQLLCVKNIHFFNSNNLDISTYINRLGEAVAVSIMFDLQKRDI